ncbi:albusnodin/ikarugamycin family macrolactam cyclase [Streptomyces sp. AC1-42T]|uniref:albusnodin/ikarugamycin family macrolactam cyclase n=1 Tax=Streptomyces sp. AC1-42T TaxID=2218665 RepID=UPI000DABDD16|nr:albusnodin/ikarugamycin family macrolactam cyclase [Streptomyces sp. AC1-42T]PZT74725.1 asparagine synthase [Streptomyces sp. AC1-42T]PZT82291.1 asparagine synthase [Streptomyces sp. AC1-42W]
MPVGGFSTTRPNLPRPLGAESFATSSLWRLGSIPVRTARRPGRRVHVIGLCAATAEEVQALAECPVPTRATWQWPGAYAVLEELAHGLVLHTDPAAALPLYAVAWQGTWAWSTSARYLGALAGAHVDTKRLACAFLAPSVPVLATGRTYFAGVEQLPPGSRIELPATGDRYTHSTTWCPDPLDGPPPHLRNALTAAVRLRADTDPALSSDLSGGLDSSTIAILASRTAPDPVNAVTVHPRGVLDGADLHYARLTAAASDGRLRHHLLPLGDEHRPYTNLTDLPVTDEPAPSTLTQTRLLAQFRWMRRELGTRSHLTGDGGDSVLFQPPAQLADLLRHRRCTRAVREAFGWARLRHIAVVPLLRSASMMTAITREGASATLTTELTSGVKPTRGDVRWFSTLPVPAWAESSAVRLLTEAAEDYAAAPAPLPGLDTSVRILVDEIREVARTAVSDAELADACGIDLHNPFLDASVVDAVLRTPVDLRPPLYAYKPVLKQAFADLLPAELVARITKGAFEADHYGGLRAALPQLLDTGGMNLAALGLIDTTRFREQIRHAAAGVPMPLAHIEQALAADAWLHTITHTPDPAWDAAAPGKVE